MAAAFFGDSFFAAVFPAGAACFAGAAFRAGAAFFAGAAVRADVFFTAAFFAAAFFTAAFFAGAFFAAAFFAAAFFAGAFFAGAFFTAAFFADRAPDTFFADAFFAALFFTAFFAVALRDVRAAPVFAAPPLRALVPPARPVFFVATFFAAFLRAVLPAVPRALAPVFLLVVFFPVPRAALLPADRAPAFFAPAFFAPAFFADRAPDAAFADDFFAALPLRDAEREVPALREAVRAARFSVFFAVPVLRPFFVAMLTSSGAGRERNVRSAPAVRTFVSSGKAPILPCGSWSMGPANIRARARTRYMRALVRVGGKNRRTAEGGGPYRRRLAGADP